MRKILIILSSLFFVMVVAAFVIPYMVDVNNYKKEITSLIKEKTGRDVNINGKVSLRVIPNLAISLDNVVVASTIDSNKTLFSVENVILEVKLRPLIHGKVEIESFKFVKPDIHLYTSKTGKKNWVIEETKNKAPVQAKSAEVSAEDLEDGYVNLDEEESEGASSWLYSIFQFNDIRIVDGNFLSEDEQTGKSLSISKINLRTSIQDGQSPFQISGKLNIFKDEKQGDFSLEGKYYLSGGQYNIKDVKISFDKIEGHSEALVDMETTPIDTKLSLYFGDIDLRNYEMKDAKGSSSDSSGSEGAASKEFSWSDQNIDLSALFSLDLNLNFKSGAVKYDSVSIGNLMFNAYLKGGKLTVVIKEAGIYHGNITGEVVVDNGNGKRPVFRSKMNLENINLADINALKSKSGEEVTGVANASLDIYSIGNSQREIVNNLSGNANLRAAEGAIKGIDLFSMLKNVTSAINLGTNSGQTKFQEISGDFVAQNGIISNDNFVLKSDALNFVGAGKVNLNAMTVDYKLLPKYSQDFEKDKKNLNVPIVISGSLFKPAFRLEVSAVVQDLIKNPQGAENLVKDLKNNFKSLKKKGGSPDLKNLQDNLQNMFHQ